MGTAYAIRRTQTAGRISLTAADCWLLTPDCWRLVADRSTKAPLPVKKEGFLKVRMSINMGTIYCDPQPATCELRLHSTSAP